MKFSCYILVDKMHKELQLFWLGFTLSIYSEDRYCNDEEHTGKLYKHFLNIQFITLTLLRITWRTGNFIDGTKSIRGFTISGILSDIATVVKLKCPCGDYFNCINQISNFY